MNQRLLDSLFTDKRRPATLGALTIIAAALGAGGMYLAQKMPLPGMGHSTAGAVNPHSDSEEEEHDENGPLVLPKQKWKNANIRIAKVSRSTFQKKQWVTGKLTINEDRTAHVYPLVDGRVHSVNVRFGQQVKANDVLAVIDSRELGDAKLALYQSRLDAHIAKVNSDWAETINKNTQALIAALKKQTSLPDLERMFRDKPIGENRSKLLTAYANLYKSRVDYERLKPLGRKGIASGKQVLAAKASYEADQATFHAWLEQLKFTARQMALMRQQQLDKALSSEAIARSKLYILGYTSDQLKQIDPQTEGEKIARYQIRAPFDGTIVNKNVVLLERAAPTAQLFELTDLTTLWLQADIYQQHLPLLRKLSGNTIRFRSGHSGHEHQAQVFYRGEMIDPKTRTARLMAVVPNPDGHLKPGMFVEVELPGTTISNVLQVPISAVQSFENQTFVFVHLGGEKFIRRNVTTGRSSDGLIEIRSGLKPGEQIVTQGAFALKSEMLKELMSED